MSTKQFGKVEVKVPAHPTHEAATKYTAIGAWLNILIMKKTKLKGIPLRKKFENTKMMLSRSDTMKYIPDHMVEEANQMCTEE